MSKRTFYDRTREYVLQDMLRHCDVAHGWGYACSCSIDSDFRLDVFEKAVIERYIEQESSGDNVPTS